MDFTTENRGSRTSLKEFEKDLLKEGLLRLRPFFKKDIKNDSLEKFIKNFIGKYNNDNELETIFVDSEESQCESGLRRSGGDIFRLCKYYYPKCTLEQVLMILDNLIITNAVIGEEADNEYLKSNICREIRKRVFISHECSVTNHAKERDEFNRLAGEYNNKKFANLEVDNDEDEDDDF